MLSRNRVSYTYDATRMDAVSAFGAITYTYDANGNRSSRTEGSDVWQYRHDAENRLVEVKLNGSTLARYTYNGDGQRVLAVTGDEKTVYIGDYFEARSDESVPVPVYTPGEGYNLYFPLVTGGGIPDTGRIMDPPPHTEWRTYYTLGSLRVGMRVQGGSRAAGGVQYALLSDHLGSVVGSVNRLGTLTGSARYGAWGEERVSTGTLPTDRGYTGQLEADEVGLYFYNARWYDYELARFVEADSIVPDPGSAVAYERYTYALNNPIRYNDPTGHRDCEECGREIITDPTYDEYYDYVYYGLHDNEEREQNTQTIENSVGVVKLLIGTFSNTADIALTTADCIMGDCNYYTYLFAALPILPSTLGKYVDDIIPYFSDGTNIIDTYSNLRNKLSGTNFQAHHLIDKRFARALGQTVEQTRNWPSIAVTREQHQVFTNLWREAIGYSNQTMTWTTLNATPQVIWREVQKIYADYPTLLDAARVTIFGK